MKTKKNYNNKDKIYLHPTLHGTETENMSHYEFNAVPYNSGIVVSGTSHNVVRIPYQADLNTARYLCQILLNNMHTTLSFKSKIFLYAVEKIDTIFK